MMNKNNEMDRLYRQLEQNKLILAEDPATAVAGLAGTAVGILMKLAEQHGIETDPFTMRGMLEALHRQGVLDTQLRDELDVMRRCRNEVVMNHYHPAPAEAQQCLAAAQHLLAYYEEQKGGDGHEQI